MRENSDIAMLPQHQLQAEMGHSPPLDVYGATFPPTKVPL